MNILKYGYIAIALFSGAIATSCSASDKTYEKTINAETITWEQIDPGVRKFFIKSVAYGMEKANVLIGETDALAVIIKTLEMSLDVDSSDLSGEYKAYWEASIPLIKAIIEDLKKEESIPLPTSMAGMEQYQQAILDTVMKVRDKHQSEFDELKRKYPNATALFDSPQPGISQPKIMELFAAKYNIEQMAIENFMTSSSSEEAIRKTAQQLYALAEEQK